MLSKNIEQKLSILLFEAPFNPPPLLLPACPKQGYCKFTKKKGTNKMWKHLPPWPTVELPYQNFEILSSSKPCVKCVKVFLEEESHLNYLSGITNHVFFICRNTDNLPPPQMFVANCYILGPLVYYTTYKPSARGSLCILTVLCYCLVISLMWQNHSNNGIS